MEITQFNRLNLLTGASVTDAADAGGCCGGGSCMCSSGAASTPAFDLAGSRGLVTPAAPATPDAPAALTTEFLVTGMTCGHCVSSVSEEVGAVAGVDAVEVILKKGGASRVTVSSATPVDADAVRAAVEEAGYQLA
ncbi:heavy-metal-associated domain-containing protein [Microcella sp.]|uniref:heavy-metal-associated domain-containing protein n=1 Tax=Microcella sp. TaxID=1913979 RepID=UPI00299F597F|nr:cation transporter [Microcella sp.]MDX2026292.1 cation transporter [Microcella sp.]